MNLSDYISAWSLAKWLGVWNVLGFLGMVVDKQFAEHGFGRISEMTFYCTALIGGFAGIIIGGWLARHKTSKTGFWVPVGLATVLWLAILTLYFSPWLVTF
jgi:uncharacterized membrane protein YsdA (DUF1294 family)